MQPPRCLSHSAQCVRACVLRLGHHRVFPRVGSSCFSLMPSKAGRRMGVGKQSPFRSPPLPRIHAQPPPFTQANLSSTGHNQNPTLARERPGLRGGGAEGVNADSVLPSRCLCMSHPLPLSSMLFGLHWRGTASTPAPPGGRLPVSPPHLPPCQRALAHLCCHLKEQPFAPTFPGHCCYSGQLPFRDLWPAAGNGLLAVAAIHLCPASEPME